MSRSTGDRSSDIRKAISKCQRYRNFLGNDTDELSDSAIVIHKPLSRSDGVEAAHLRRPRRPFLGKIAR